MQLKQRVRKALPLRPRHGALAHQQQVQIRPTLDISAQADGAVQIGGDQPGTVFLRGVHYVLCLRQRLLGEIHHKNSS